MIHAVSGRAEHGAMAGSAVIASATQWQPPNGSAIRVAPRMAEPRTGVPPPVAPRVVRP